MRIRSQRVRSIALLGCFVFCALSSVCRGNTFEFDLTNAITAGVFPDALVDLGTPFAGINSAEVHFQANHTPGLITLLTIPEGSGPVLPWDTGHLFVRLGEEGSSWIDKDVYASQVLTGLSGALEFTLPLVGSQPNAEGLPSLLPSGEESPNFDFLLDGRFGIAMWPLHPLASIYQEVEPPRFDLSELTLVIEGTAVPEPTSSILVVMTWLFLTTARYTVHLGHATSSE